MGGTESKSEEKTVNTEVQPVQVNDESSGFHVLELHMPTVGFGVTSVVLCAILFIACILVYRRLAKRWVRRTNYPHPMPMPAWPPVASGRPSIIYVTETGHIRSTLPPPRIHELREDYATPPSRRQNDGSRDNDGDDRNASASQRNWVDDAP
jgi:hypothetical protein